MQNSFGGSQFANLIVNEFILGKGDIRRGFCLERITNPKYGIAAKCSVENVHKVRDTFLFAIVGSTFLLVLSFVVRQCFCYTSKDPLFIVLRGVQLTTCRERTLTREAIH